MKNYLLCIAIPLIILSCSTEEEITSKNSHAGLELGDPSFFPKNGSNPFEQTGIKYYENLNW